MKKRSTRAEGGKKNKSERGSFPSQIFRDKISHVLFTLDCCGVRRCSLSLLVAAYRASTHRVVYHPGVPRFVLVP